MRYISLRYLVETERQWCSDTKTAVESLRNEWQMFFLKRNHRMKIYARAFFLVAWINHCPFRSHVLKFHCRAWRKPFQRTNKSRENANRAKETVSKNIKKTKRERRKKKKWSINEYFMEKYNILFAKCFLVFDVVIRSKFTEIIPEMRKIWILWENRTIRLHFYRINLNRIYEWKSSCQIPKSIQRRRRNGRQQTLTFVCHAEAITIKFENVDWSAGTRNPMFLVSYCCFTNACITLGSRLHRIYSSKWIRSNFSADTSSSSFSFVASIHIIVWHATHAIILASFSVNSQWFHWRENRMLK